MLLNKIVFLASLFFLSFCIDAQTGMDKLIDEFEEFETSIKIDNNVSWPIIDESGIRKKLEFYSGTIKNLESIPSRTLDSSDRINKDMLLHILKDRLFLLEYGSHYMPLNSEGGFITSMIYNSQSVRIDSRDDAADFAEKIKDTPRYLNQQINLMAEGLEKGILRPRLVVENCLDILYDLIEVSENEFFLYLPIREYQDLIKAEEWHTIKQSFNRLVDFLEREYLPASRKDIGIVANPEGRSYYEQRVAYYTTLDITPEEVYETGLAEVQRIKAEMEVVMRNLGYSGSMNSFIEFLRTDKQFYAESAEELLYYAAWLSKKAEELLPRYFSHLPRLPFTVNPVPSSIAANYTSGRYSGGSLDGQRAGQYWVNTYKLESRPLFMLPALTLHEAVPGHHLQGSLASELKDLPDFRRQYLSAFGEGWGLYSEYLGKEAGYYKSLYDEFGRLSYEMWRACRLVIDPGIHVFGWSREKAVDYMRSHTALSPHEIETEINRYIGWPGQAVSYKIGELKIRSLRLKAEETLGDRFDIRRFHDLVLSNGSVPLETLEWIVNDYIENINEDEQKN